MDGRTVAPICLSSERLFAWLFRATAWVVPRFLGFINLRLELQGRKSRQYRCPACLSTSLSVVNKKTFQLVPSDLRVDSTM